MADWQKTTVYLEADAYRRLKFVARETASAPAELIRVAIREFLDSRAERRKPRSLGAGQSLTGDLSERAEEYLSGFGDDAAVPNRRRRAK